MKRAERFDARPPTQQWFDEQRGLLETHVEHTQRLELLKSRFIMVETSCRQSQSAHTAALEAVVKCGPMGDGLHDALLHLRERTRWLDVWKRDLAGIEKQISVTNSVLDLLERQLGATPYPEEAPLGTLEGNERAPDPS